MVRKSQYGQSTFFENRSVSFPHLPLNGSKGQQLCPSLVSVVTGLFSENTLKPQAPFNHTALPSLILPIKEKS